MGKKMPQNNPADSPFTSYLAGSHNQIQHRRCQSRQFTAAALMQFLGMMCLQEELNVALFHIKDVSGRQREVQRRIELLQAQNTKDIIPVPHR